MIVQQQRSEATGNKVDSVVSECRELLNAHGFADWSIRVGSAKQQAGSCNYRKKLITLSSVVIDLNPLAEGLETARHEVAHTIAGPGHGLDEVWKRIAREVGATPKACGNFLTALKRWQLVCGKCGRHLQRYHRRQFGLKRWYHGGCPNSEGTLYLIDLHEPAPQEESGQLMFRFAGGE